MHLKSKRLTTSSATDSLLAEVFLNTRNFLIITNALLNPDNGNITTALSPCLLMLERFLAFALENPAMLPVGVMILRELVFAVLIFFGITYLWVSSANPGARVGLGVGIALAFLVSVLVRILCGGISPFWLRIELFWFFLSQGIL